MADDIARRSVKLELRRRGRMLALAAGLAFGATPPAAAHGSADWIMKNNDFGWCCGPKDCFWLEPEEVRVDGDHYVVDRFSIRWSIIGSFPSVNHHYWACYFMRGTEHQQLKCFFAPKPVG